MLVPGAMAFAVAAGAMFAASAPVRVAEGAIESRLVVPGSAPALEGVRWSDRAVSPAERQALVARRQLRMALVLAGLLTGIALLAAGSFELVRQSARRREFAVHRAVGASRRDLARTARSDAAWVTLTGLTLGWAFGSSAVHAWLAVWPGTVAEGLSVPLTLTVTALLGTAFSTLSYGSWKAVSGTGSASPGVAFRTPPADPYAEISVLQMAGSVALVVVSAVLVAPSLNDGADDAALGGLAVEVRASEPLDTTRLVATIRELDGVSSVILGSAGSFEGLGTSDLALTECGRCLIGTSPVNFKGEAAVHVALAGAVPEGITVSEGRWFGPEDAFDSEPVAVVSALFAQRNFERGDAVGRRVRPGAEIDAWHRVIGIVSGGIPRTGFGSGAQPEPGVFLSAVQHPPSSADLLVAGPIGSVSLERALRVLTSTNEISVRPRSAAERDRAAPAGWFGRLFAAFSGLALLASVAGIVAVTKLSLDLQRSELGVRRAVGARRGRIVARALGQPLRTAVIGSLIGLWASTFFLDVLSDSVGNPTLPVSVYVSIALLHLVAALLGGTPHDAARHPGLTTRALGPLRLTGQVPRFESDHAGSGRQAPLPALAR